MNELVPTVGQWYERADGMRFEVIDIDDGDGQIEVQIEDGSLDAIDSDDWTAIDIKLSVQPEDPTAAYDNVPLPDEADGGDPVQLDAAPIEPQKVAAEELVNSPENESDNDLGEI